MANRQDHATSSNPTPPPADYEKLVELYFLEHRAKVLDIAAFFDRLDRAEPQPKDPDFRVAALRSALAIVMDGQSERAARILSVLSDHTTEPIAKAPLKGAYGACPPETGSTP